MDWNGNINSSYMDNPLRIHAIYREFVWYSDCRRIQSAEKCSIKHHAIRSKDSLRSGMDVHCLRIDRHHNCPSHSDLETAVTCSSKVNRSEI